MLTRPRHDVVPYPMTHADLAGPRHVSEPLARFARRLATRAELRSALAELIRSGHVRVWRVDGVEWLDDDQAGESPASKPGEKPVCFPDDGKPKRPGRDSRALQSSPSGPYGEARGRFAVRSQKAPTS